MDNRESGQSVPQQQEAVANQAEVVEAEQMNAPIVENKDGKIVEGLAAGIDAWTKRKAQEKNAGEIATHEGQTEEVDREKQPVIVLDSTEKQVKQGMRQSAESGARWKAEISNKIHEAFKGRVLYKEVAEQNDLAA